MNISNDEIYTAKTADVVASGIAHLMANPGLRFELELTHYVTSEGKLQRSPQNEALLISLIEDDPRVITFANGREMVRCITSDGRRLDIFFGHENERRFEPAFVLIENQP